jgi:hypothetical protein
VASTKGIAVNTPVTYIFNNIPAGTHHFIAMYSKDGSVSAGNDKGYVKVDSVAGVIKSSQPVELTRTAPGVFIVKLYAETAEEAGALWNSNALGYYASSYGWAMLSANEGFEYPRKWGMVLGGPVSSAVMSANSYVVFAIACKNNEADDANEDVEGEAFVWVYA